MKPERFKPGALAVLAGALAGCQASTTTAPIAVPSATPAAPATPRATTTPIAMPTLGGGSSSAPTAAPFPTRTPLPPGVSPSPTPAIVATTLPAGPKLYVANHGKEGATPSVTIYAATAAGNAAPLATLAGPATGQQQIQFPAVDGAGDLYLSDAGLAGDAGSGSVAFYGALGQVGNQPPSFRLGPFPHPEGLAFDAAGDVFVATAGGVTIYPPNPSAASAPLRTLHGDLGPGEDVYGIAVDGAGKLYLALSNQVEVYAAGASGSAAPVQEFDLQSDPAAGLASCLGIAVDASGDIYCANFNAGTITEYAAGSSGPSTVPTITARDPTSTSLDEPFGIAVDAAGTVYVSNYGNSSIAVFPSGTLASGTAAVRIAGSATGLNFPYGVAVR